MKIKAYIIWRFTRKKKIEEAISRILGNISDNYFNDGEETEIFDFKNNKFSLIVIKPNFHSAGSEIFWAATRGELFLKLRKYELWLANEKKQHDEVVREMNDEWDK